jgi:hypothetical protein
MALENTNDGDLITIEGTQYRVIDIHEGWHDETGQQEIQMTVREATSAEVLDAQNAVDPLAGVAMDDFTFDDLYTATLQAKRLANTPPYRPHYVGLNKITQRYDVMINGWLGTSYSTGIHKVEPRVPRGEWVGGTS